MKTGDIINKVLSVVIALLLSTVTWIGIQTLNKVDKVVESVQKIEVSIAVYKEKVDELTKKAEKK